MSSFSSSKDAVDNILVLLRKLRDDVANDEKSDKAQNDAT
jgi:hypothetical protein